MVPYLKGIHLTIDGWWEGRDEEGFKRRRKAKPKGGGLMTWEWEAERWVDADPTDLERMGDGSQEVPEMVKRYPASPQTSTH
jgi:hypothetical protein